MHEIENRGVAASNGPGPELRRESLRADANMIHKPAPPDPITEELFEELRRCPGVDVGNGGEIWIHTKQDDLTTVREKMAPTGAAARAIIRDRRPIANEWSIKDLKTLPRMLDADAAKRHAAAKAKVERVFGVIVEAQRKIERLQGEIRDLLAEDALARGEARISGEAEPKPPKGLKERQVEIDQERAIVGAVAGRHAEACQEEIAARAILIRQMHTGQTDQIAKLDQHAKELAAEAARTEREKREAVEALPPISKGDELVQVELKRTVRVVIGSWNENGGDIEAFFPPIKNSLSSPGISVDRLACADLFERLREWEADPGRTTRPISIAVYYNTASGKLVGWDVVLARDKIGGGYSSDGVTLRNTRGTEESIADRVLELEREAGAISDPSGVRRYVHMLCHFDRNTVLPIERGLLE